MEKPSQDTEAPLLKSHDWYSDDSESLPTSANGRQHRSTPFFRLSHNTLTSYSRSLPMVIVGLLLINTVLLLDQRRHSSNLVFPPESHQTSTVAAPSLLEDFYRSIKIPITQKTFVAEDGASYSIPRVYWTKPLGSDVLIMDVDTRSQDRPGEFLSNQTVTWDQLSNQEGGRLSHYMYAMIHGYDYTFVQTNELPDRHGTWVRQPMMKEGLKTHKIVVSMDADAVWNHPEIPLEWLLNYWSVTPQTSFAVAGDWDHTVDSHGKTGMNGGFVIAQQLARTDEILDAWIDCPTGRQFPGCETLAYGPYHEQTAFNEYIRYAYNETNDYIQLSCDESDGFAGAGFDCKGIFISHFWILKDLLKQGVAATVMRPLYQRMVDSLVDNKEKYVVRTPTGSGAAR